MKLDHLHTRCQVIFSSHLKLTPIFPISSSLISSCHPCIHWKTKGMWHILALVLQNRHIYICLSRTFINLLVRIGHTHLTHDYLMAPDTPLVCTYCRVRLSVPHLLFDCPRYRAAHRLFPILSSLRPSDHLSYLLSISTSFNHKFI